MGNGASQADLRATWEAAAPGWAKWESAFSAGLEQITDELLDMAGIRPGAKVLDVACGAGAQTVKAARRVSPTGLVVASDISGLMLEHVRQRAKADGLTNIETIEGPAETLRMAESSFDAAICRLGLMLFPRPVAAVEKIRLALKPTARFAALVFTNPANNPFMAQPMAILLRHAGKQPAAPGQPGIFALGGAGVLECLLWDSGLNHVATTIARATLRLPSPTVALEMIQQAFGAYRAVVADLGESEKAAAWSEVGACLQQFQSRDGFSTELEFVIGKGSR